MRTGRTSPTSRRAGRLAAVALLAVLSVGAVACGGDDPAVPRGVAVDASTPADVTFTIPKGSSTRPSATPVLPSPLVLKVGQVIRIINEDDVGYDLGTFYVGARETLTQRAATVGSYTSACTLHPSGSITLTITR